MRNPLGSAHLAGNGDGISDTEPLRVREEPDDRPGMVASNDDEQADENPPDRRVLLDRQTLHQVGGRRLTEAGHQLSDQFPFLRLLGGIAEYGIVTPQQLNEARLDRPALLSGELNAGGAGPEQHEGSFEIACLHSLRNVLAPRLDQTTEAIRPVLHLQEDTKNVDA